MKKREVVAVLGFTFLIFVSLLSVFLLGNFIKFSGMAVWEIENVVENCNITQINDLWDEIFKESSSGVTIFKENEEDCNNFVAYKTQGLNDFFILFYSNEAGDGELWSWREGYQILNYSKSFAGFWGNFTEESRAPILDRMIDYVAAMELLENIGSYEINSWEISLVDAESLYSNKFKILIDGPFEEDLGEGSTTNGYSSGESENYEDSQKSIMGVVGKERQFIQVMGFYYFFSEEKAIEFKQTKNFPNFEILVNSSWDDALDLDDYFESDVDLSYSVRSFGDNENGSKIDMKVSSGNVLSFEPAKNYKGTESFVIKAGSGEDFIESNIFNVSVLEKINYAPKLVEEIGNIFLERGESIELNMYRYFTDSNDDKLSFSFDRGRDLKLSAKNNLVTVSLGENFESYDSFFIIASDGKLTKKSNEILVFLEEGVVEEVVVEDNKETSTNLTNSSLEDVEEKKGFAGLEENWIYWILGVFCFLVFLFGVLMIIYFIRLREDKKRKEYFEKEESEKSVQLNNYLNEVSGSGVENNDIDKSNEVKRLQTAVQTEEKRVNLGKNEFKRPFVSEKLGVQTDKDVVKESVQTDKKDLNEKN